MEGNATRDGFARRFLLVGLIAMAFALSCTSAAAAAVVTARNSMEPTLVDRINDVRAAHGLRRLRVSSLLTNAATRHANSMGAVGYFKDALYTPSHSVMWTSYGTWIDWYWPGAGYTSGAASENRTWGAPDLSARAAVKRWMNRARNRANLLTATWRRVGVAAVRVSNPLGYYGASDEVTIVVAEFGRRSDLRDPVAPPPPPPPPPPHDVRYQKTAEPNVPLFGPDSLEEACYPNLPPYDASRDYCRWYGIQSQVGCQVRDSSQHVQGAYSIKMRIPNAASASNARCEMGKLRRVDAFTTDYFHFAFKLAPGWGESGDGGPVIEQINYQSIVAAPLLLGLDDLNDSAYVLVVAGPCAAGTCDYYSGQPIGGGYAPKPVGMPGPLYVVPPGSLTRGVWHEVLYRIYWTPNLGGELEAWEKVNGSWVKRVDLGPVGSGHATEFNFPTLQTGTNSFGQTITASNINDPSHAATQDKFGQYGPAVSNGTIWIDGWCRATSFDAAASC
jgi:uncharacterized protein YkwD